MSLRSFEQLVADGFLEADSDAEGYFIEGTNCGEGVQILYKDKDGSTEDWGACVFRFFSLNGKSVEFYSSAGYDHVNTHSCLLTKQVFNVVKLVSI